MVFALTGFTNELSLRRFTFELAGSGPPRTTVVVVADMTLVRKYEIPLQELPCYAFAYSKAGQRTQTLRQCSRKRR